MQIQSLGQEDPYEEEMAMPVFLPGRSHGWRSLTGYSPWDRKRVGHNLVTKQQQNNQALHIGLQKLLNMPHTHS